MQIFIFSIYHYDDKFHSNNKEAQCFAHPQEGSSRDTLAYAEYNKVNTGCRTMDHSNKPTQNLFDV